MSQKDRRSRTPRNGHPQQLSTSGLRSRLRATLVELVGARRDNRVDFRHIFLLDEAVWVILDPMHNTSTNLAFITHACEEHGVEHWLHVTMPEHCIDGEPDDSGTILTHLLQIKQFVAAARLRGNESPACVVPGLWLIFNQPEPGYSFVLAGLTIGAEKAQEAAVSTVLAEMLDCGLDFVSDEVAHTIKHG